MPPIVPPVPSEPPRDAEEPPPKPGAPPSNPGVPPSDAQWYAHRVGDANDLKRLVHGLAKEVVLGISGWVSPLGRDFIEEAPQILAKKLLAAKRPPHFAGCDAIFIAWARRWEHRRPGDRPRMTGALPHAWIDWIKKQSRQPRIAPELRPEDQPVRTIEPGWLAREFEPAVSDRIERWTLQERVWLLIYAWVWKRIPEAMWDGWVVALGWDSPFPPEEMPVGRGPRDWHGTVAEILEMSPRKLSQFLYRHHDRLKDLPQIPWLDPGNELPGRRNRQRRDPE